MCTMLKRMHSVARNEKNRRAKHPPGITFVIFEHHFVSKNSRSVIIQWEKDSLLRGVGSRQRTGNMA
jgi:hypothetical protein